MNSLLPSSVPASELELARAVGRVATRYATYPPLSAFREGEGEHPRPYVQAHAARNVTDVARSIYVHLPFCYTAWWVLQLPENSA